MERGGVELGNPQLFKLHSRRVRKRKKTTTSIYAAAHGLVLTLPSVLPFLIGNSKRLSNFLKTAFDVNRQLLSSDFDGFSSRVALQKIRDRSTFLGGPKSWVFPRDACLHS